MYATQAATDPPTFVLFTNHPHAVPEPYLRYLRKGLRERFGFDGSPLRIRIRARAERKNR
jgi:GTP-binding protein